MPKFNPKGADPYIVELGSG